MLDIVVDAVLYSIPAVMVKPANQVRCIVQVSDMPMHFFEKLAYACQNQHVIMLSCQRQIVVSFKLAMLPPRVACLALAIVAGGLAASLPYCQDDGCQLSWTPVPNMGAALVGYDPGKGCEQAVWWPVGWTVGIKY